MQPQPSFAAPERGWPPAGLREQCGVLAVSSPGTAAAPLLHLGLLALQHRGQESAGIATWDGVRLHERRGMGLVAQVFDAGAIAALAGEVGLGHVRYATMGSSVLANAQPVIASSPHWGLPVAVAHNGNLVNAPALRAELEAAGARFRRSSDTEAIALLIAHPPAGHERPEDAVASAMQRLEGAFSAAALLGGTLFAFRDRHGIRPLELGRLPGGGWVVASESCAFDHMGAEPVREVAPGELVVIEGAQLRARAVLLPPAPARCVFEYIYFARPDSELAGRNVHRVRRRMGEILAAEHPATADVVFPVPDSGVAAALGYAGASGLPFELGLVKSRYIGRTFIQPGQAARDAGVRMKLNPIRSLAEGQRVVLVDDSIVRGTTSARLVRMLRAAGAREVHLRIASPPIRWPCFYGVDTSSRLELVAGQSTIEQIRAGIGADSLGYLSLEGLVRAIGLERQALCMACLDGRYPTRTPTEAEAGRHALERAEGRESPAGEQAPVLGTPRSAGP
ncbi:MAG: amidophosphoribosyltransferase [Planctomycetota bacterium]|nr:MAG: amidophosphoribosyltransferase [Planctomycetota bacterium]